MIFLITISWFEAWKDINEKLWGENRGKWIIEKWQFIFNRGMLNISCKFLMNYGKYIYIIIIIIMRNDRFKMKEIACEA